MPDDSLADAMGPVDFIWHVANLFAVPVLFGCCLALAARLGWRRAVSHWPLWKLGAALSAAAGAVTVCGLLALGRDGRMLTYAAMVLSGVAVLAWVGRRQLLA